MIIPLKFTPQFLKKIIDNKICFIYGNERDRFLFFQFLFENYLFFYDFKILKDVYTSSLYFSDMISQLYKCRNLFLQFLEENRNKTIIFNNGPLYGVSYLTVDFLLSNTSLTDQIVDDLCIDLINFSKRDDILHILLYPQSFDNDFKEKCIFLIIKEVCKNYELPFIDLKI